MLKHIVTIISISALIVLCMLLPFLPGRYDSLAVTISFMAQIFGWVSLVLIPLGVYWAWVEIARRKTGAAPQKKAARLAIATVVLLMFIAFALSFGSITNHSLAFGILFLVLTFSLLVRTYFKLKRTGYSDSSGPNPIPLYLIVIPLVAATVKFAFIPMAVQFSREHAIRQSEPLISAIETYYAKYGRYPISLQAVHTDISPRIIGIKQFHYEPNGAAYNLYFRQFSDELDVEEIVMYNKLDEHAFAAHASDILEYSGQELALRRGDRHKYDLPTPHWIYIKFD